jgi:hypothetical protein
VEYDFKKETLEVLKEFCKNPIEKVGKMKEHLQKVSDSFLNKLREFYKNSILRTKEMKEYVMWHFGTSEQKKSFFSLSNYYTINNNLNTEYEWKIRHRHPMEIVSNLLQFLLTSMRNPMYWELNQESQPIFQRDKFILRKEWQQFKESTGEMTQMNLNILKESEYIPFFTNLYNLILLDSTLTSGKSYSVKSLDFLRCWKYSISGLSFSIDDILNGILLNGRNSNSLIKYYRELFSKDDPRKNFIIKDLPMCVIFSLADMTGISSILFISSQWNHQRLK